jgi:two-component system cell cycle response regulator
VNDLQGHDVGDRVIVAVAAQVVVLDAVSGRLGGEEFCLLVEHDLARALAVAEELRKAIGKLRFDVNGAAVGVTASLGVAQWEPGDSIDRLLRRADVALYQAKNGGRNCVMAAQTDAEGQFSSRWRSVVRAGSARAQ